MKERFRTYVWRCRQCGQQWSIKPKHPLCPRPCCGLIIKEAPPTLVSLMKSMGINAPEVEYEFTDKAGWRFDWAWESRKIALEACGGIWMKKGAHNTGKALQRDYAKASEAAALGWRVLYFTPQEITSGAFLDTLKRAWEAA